ncbi:MAG: hypothetical protein LAP40_28665 [Acidobacteriia bacterium]|nr:hypothetical protein [Terriglobia bacterium]
MGPGALILILVACIAIASGIVFAIRKTAPRPETLPVTADWIEELSLERYRPMQRLLDEEEFRSLRLQDGFTRRMAHQMRRQRCQIFRGYLRSLRSDFARVSLALKLLMMQAGEDRPDLAATLLRTQLAFTWSVTLIQIKLTFFSLGIGTVNVGNLLSLFDGLRLELRTLVPATMQAGV